jgi:integrase
MEELEVQSARGYINSEEQFRTFMSEKFRLLFGKDSEPDLITRPWLELWLQNVRGTIALKSWKHYNSVVQNFISFLGSKASLRLEAISLTEITLYRDHLLQLGYSESTINQHIIILVAPFREARKKEYIRHNPVEDVKALRENRVQRGTFSPRQVTQLLAAAHSSEWRTLILLAFYTGARLKDLVSLKWENVDLAEGSLTFIQHKTAHHKGAAPLKVPLHSELQDYLLAMPTCDNPEAPILPRLFQTDISSLSRTFKLIMKVAQIDPGAAKERKGVASNPVSRLSFHSLRHSFTSALANAGVSSELRQKLTGHADAKSHAIYTHHEFQTIREALEKLARLPKEDEAP